MTDEEIKQLALETMARKYCDKIEKNKKTCDECTFCQNGDGRIWCIKYEYQMAFIDGYKAAFDVLIDKIKKFKP